MKILITRFGHTENEKKKQNSSNNKITKQILLFLILFIICAIALTIIIARIAQNNISTIAINNTLDSIWLGSIASYLGGTIGGIFSGAFAFLGVFYTIKYYKESDKEKEKVSMQPFLLVTPGTTKRPSRGYYLGLPEDKDSATKEIHVTIKNIGNGFASLVVIHTGYIAGGVKYNKVLPVNDFDEIRFMINPSLLEDGITFDLQYIDAMRNEYIQSYVIRSKFNTIDIETEYPKPL